ncbi:MAG TPA: cupin domain-containing protein [bacterium]|nr:cupin domain-containing protein [bacterium]
MTALARTTLESAPVVFSQEGMIGKRLAAHPKAEIVHLAIEPGKGLALHTMPMPVLFFVIEGTGTLRTADGAERHAAGSLVECPADTLRGWTNEGTAPLNVLVIKLVG